MSEALELIEAEVVEVESVEHWLDDCADEIKTLEWTLQRKTEDVRKRQGEILLEVKARLGHGHFMEWLESIGWSDRTARSYMALLKPAKEPKAITPNDGKLAETAVLEVKPIKKYADQFFEPESTLVEDFEQDEEVLHELYALPEEVTDCSIVEKTWNACEKSRQENLDSLSENKTAISFDALEHLVLVALFSEEITQLTGAEFLGIGLEDLGRLMQENIENFEHLKPNTADYFLACEGLAKFCDQNGDLIAMQLGGYKQERTLFMQFRRDYMEAITQRLEHSS